MSFQRLDVNHPTIATNTIPECLAEWARRQPDAPAILAPGRTPLSHGGLWEQIKYVAGSLRSVGLGPGDRIGVVIPPGPEQACAITCIAACAIAAPLDPEAKAEELVARLLAVRAKGIVSVSDKRAEAQQAARRLGIPYLELQIEPGAPAGSFGILCDGERLSGCLEPQAQPEDGAYIMLTSGTTGSPKSFVCSHRGLFRSVTDRAENCGLTPRDRSVAIRPMHLSAGLRTGLFLALLSGGSIVCLPDLEEASFVRWIGEFLPTWYTATPFLHRIITEWFSRHPELLEAWGPRFVTAGGAPLDAALHTNMLATLRAPVIVQYNVSEVGLISMTPMPPAAPKPGSVGVPVRRRVAIMDADVNRVLIFPIFRDLKFPTSVRH